jgi:hypothetical protein
MNGFLVAALNPAVSLIPALALQEYEENQGNSLNSVVPISDRQCFFQTGFEQTGCGFEPCGVR